MSNNGTSLRPLDAALTQRFRAIVDRFGHRRACSLLCISTPTGARVLAGLPVIAAMHTHLQIYIPQVEKQKHQELKGQTP